MLSSNNLFLKTRDQDSKCKTKTNTLQILSQVKTVSRPRHVSRLLNTDHNWRWPAECKTIILHTKGLIENHCNSRMCPVAAAAVGLSSFDTTWWNEMWRRDNDVISGHIAVYGKV